MNFIKLCEQAHEQAIQWWMDNEGNPIERNNGELVALMHSEVDEAYLGLGEGADEHLPNRLNFHVELGDVCIRIADYCGGRDMAQEVNEYVGDYPEMRSLDDEELLMNTHVYLTQALEGMRKGINHDVYMGLGYAYSLCMLMLGDNADVIYEKMEYNAQRADHKIENRMKEGGKKF